MYVMIVSINPKKENKYMDIIKNYDGMSKVKGKRDWHFCPRCSKKTIDRDNRICTHCKGRVIFSPEDDGNGFEREFTWVYVWFKNVFGLQGWYDKSYFQQENIIKTVKYADGSSNVTKEDLKPFKPSSF